MVSLNIDYLKGFLSANDIKGMFPLVRLAHDNLHEGRGMGKEFTGWVDLPSKIPEDLLKSLVPLSEEVQQNSDCLVSIGIGGSYLGLRAGLDFLGTSKLPVYYAGHNISGDYLHRLLGELASKRVTAIIISKSGTTTEPALAFRVIRNFLQSKYQGAELKKRIICVTDVKRGALRAAAEKGGYRTFPIPDNVGGRFSVFTPAGLVPLALAGVDIAALVDGARNAQAKYSICDFDQNPCYLYAAIRNLLYARKKRLEVLSSFYPNLFYMAEWFKQLFGESEGKQGKGIFPASLMMSTDLHSMGQWMQDAERMVFETFIQINNPEHDLEISKDEDDWDGFNYVAGKTFDFVNKKAYEATAAAHFEGGVPNMTLTIDKADARNLGHLFYFFEKACGISGYCLGINPFDQPGVETYKKKMFELLKPAKK
jgi:glucose-6-phosphate isomerase